MQPERSVLPTTADPAARVAVYTVLVGTKEPINNPLQYLGSGAGTDLQFDFLCFTDNPKLESPVWQMRPFDPGLVPHEKASRLPKARPDEFLPDHRYSLYIDNTVVFKRLPASHDLRGGALRAFKHPWRNNPIDEGDVVVREGLDLAEVVADQLRFYAKARPETQLRRLTAGTVLLREHHDPLVRRFGRLWWEQILLFSKRDQLSLDLCADEARCPIDHFAGDKLNNDLFAWPVLPGPGRRVLASFDADLYAWHHRSDAAAREAPRNHFLAHGGDAAVYKKRIPLFHYACLRTGSSLSDTAAPRRAIAAPIQIMLDRAGDSSRPILIVGFRSAEPYSVDESELAGASRAYYQYYRFGTSPPVFTCLLAVDQALDPAAFDAPAPDKAFGQILVLGLPASCHAHAGAKFRPLLGADGQVLFQFGTSLTLDQLQTMQRHNAGCALEVFHGGHVSSPTAIPSSVVLLRLGRTAPVDAESRIMEKL